MKKVFSLVLAFSILTVCAAAQVTVTVDGTALSPDGAQPFQCEDRRVMVPADTFFTALGYMISTDAETNTVLAIGADGEGGFKNIMMQADNVGLYFQNERVESDAAPMILEDTFYLPIRAVAEGLGYQVEWNEEAKTVSVITK